MLRSVLVSPDAVQMAVYRRARWRPCTTLLARQPERSLQDWLLDPSSLTARLRSACPGGFAVKPLAQAYGPAHVDERKRLGIPLGQQAFVREVFLTCRGVPWVFARTVIPQHVAKRQLRSLTRLGTRPLGEVLFSSRDLVRSDLELARLTVVAGADHESLAIWGRRSLFLRAGQPLLVSEIFLPAFLQFLERDEADES